MTLTLHARSRRRLFAASVFAAVACPVAAQTAERPEIRVGDEWKFAVYYAVRSTTPNRVWRITSVEPTRIEATENGQPLSLTRDLNVLDSPNTRETNPGLLRFPLSVGRTWRFETDWLFKPKQSRGHASVVVSVVAYEKLDVAAGTFDAFRLTSVEQLSGTSPIGSQYAGQTTRTYWYAPAARAIVKSESHNPYLGSATIELVGIVDANGSVVRKGTR